MAREEREPQDEAAERSPRRTDRLGSDRGAAGDPINPQWRSARTTGARNRPARSIPTSGQDFALWLQYGGWRVVLAAIAIIAVVAILIILTGQPADSSNALAQPTLAPANEAGVIVRTALPTVTPAPTALTTPQAAPGAKFRVTGTASDGLFLRAGPSRTDTVVKTLAEGTEVTVIGEDQSTPDIVWKHIKDGQGAEGWAASDFLKPSAP